MHTVERTAFEQVHLAAAAFFGRSADDVHRDAELVGQRRERESRAHRARGDDVVPARVSDAGQGVVLGADRDVQRARADHARERGRQLADAGVDGEAGVGQHAGSPSAGLLFFESELGVRVDPVAQRDERVRMLLDVGPGSRFGIHPR